MEETGSACYPERIPMRRSTKVAAPLLAATALSFLPGCNRPEMKRCVDAENIVVADELCSARGEQRILGRTPAAAGTYRYYYGGEGTHESGTEATGGSFLPTAGHSYEGVPTRRKGFGSSWPAFVIVGLVGAGLIYRVYGAGE